eukprot:SAG31_NODE_6271_length_2093_cov_15.145436_1_plen_516_part_00
MLRTAFCGLVRNTQQSTVSEVFLSIPRPGRSSTQRDAATVVEGEQRVRLSTVRTVASHSAQGAAGAGDTDAGSANVANPTVVPTAVGVGSQPAHPSHRHSTASVSQRPIEDLTTTEMVDGYLAPIWRHLILVKRYSKLQVDSIFKKWRDDNIKRRARDWYRHWVPYCASRGLDPYEYNAAAAGNCLAALQAQVVVSARQRRTDPQHQQFKDLRAAIARPWLLMHDADLATAPNVAAMAEANRLRNPMKARYEDTWDAELLFVHLKQLYQLGVRFQDDSAQDPPQRACPLKQHRQIAHCLLMIARAARSDDASKIPRAFVGVDPDGGLFGDSATCSITHVRYRRHKTIRSGIGHFSPAQPLGDYLRVPADEPWVSLFCVRTAMETYLRRTSQLPRLLGEQGFDMLFISAYRSGGSFAPIGPDTIAKDRASFMKDAGVPARFRPHSGRHASFARRRSEAPGDEASFLLSVNLSGPTYQKHYRVPVALGTVATLRVHPRTTDESSDLHLGETSAGSAS